MKGQKCDICKIPQKYNVTNYSKSQRCDVYIQRQKICQYVIIKYYAVYKVRKEKCRNCEKLLPKYITNIHNFFMKP